MKARPAIIAGTFWLVLYAVTVAVVAPAVAINAVLAVGDALPLSWGILR